MRAFIYAWMCIIPQIYVYVIIGNDPSCVLCILFGQIWHWFINSHIPLALWKCWKTSARSAGFVWFKAIYVHSFRVSQPPQPPSTSAFYFRVCVLLVWNWFQRYTTNWLSGNVKGQREKVHLDEKRLLEFQSTLLFLQLVGGFFFFSHFALSFVRSFVLSFVCSLGSFVFPLNTDDVGLKSSSWKQWQWRLMTMMYYEKKEPRNCSCYDCGIHY